MTSIPDQPHGPDLDALREDIDALKETPTEDLIDPAPAAARESELERTDAAGTTDWDEPGDEERTEV